MGIKKLEKKIFRGVTKAAMDYQLIEPGDRIMACMSGGKDSYVMLHMLREVQRTVPFDFSIVAVNLDQGQPNFPAHLLEDFLRREGYDYRMLQRDTYSIVLDKIPEGKTYCSLCSRMRRGILYNAAQDLGATKIALGHHRDDVIETLLLNLFFAGQLKAMPAKLFSDDGRNTVIRPLALCAESDIAELAAHMEFPILPCNLCGSQDNMQRKRVKSLLDELEATIPHIRSSIMSAIGNVRGTHLYDRPILALKGLLHLDDEAQPAPSLMFTDDAGDDEASAPDAEAPRMLRIGERVVS